LAGGCDGAGALLKAKRKNWLGRLLTIPGGKPSPKNRLLLLLLLAEAVVLAEAGVLVVDELLVGYSVVVNTVGKHRRLELVVIVYGLPG
jgi:hypothetical protein